MQAYRLSPGPRGTAQGACDTAPAMRPGIQSAGSAQLDTRAGRFCSPPSRMRSAAAVWPRGSSHKGTCRVCTLLRRGISPETEPAVGRALLLASLIFVLLGAPVAAAAPLEEAIAAYEAGDYERAIPAIEQAAEEGNAPALYWLGRAHDYGHGVSTNPDRALELYQRAAEQGFPRAQAAIAYSYNNGVGVPVDHEQAARWYLKAAEAGYVPSQRALGLMYAEGEGVEQDFEEAARWYRRAAENGDAVSARLMAEIHYRGSGPFPIDHARAAQWFHRAARKGEARAQYGLYVLYGQGLGVPHDEMTAYTWALFAARQGSAWGQKAWEGADWFLDQHQRREIERRVEAGIMPSLSTD